MPHRTGWAAIRRRARAGDTVRHVLQPQHHARYGDRNRPLDRRAFLRALREGRRPDGASYFPVFPYPSFTNISDADVRSIKAYLFSLKPALQANRAHDVAWPFSWRLLQTGWRLLFFREGPFRADPSHDAEYNRGAYLVTALAHCGECHTPRNCWAR